MFTRAYALYYLGEYKKFNSNSGYVSEDCRRTPQAFSHFSFEQSGREKMIIDIQGDFETDFGDRNCHKIFRSQ